MANPKRQHSKQRRDKRRANWKSSIPNLTNCPQCNQPKLSHRLCANCGYYNKREIIAL